jgi:hypothetical protein
MREVRQLADVIGFSFPMPARGREPIAIDLSSRCRSVVCLCA